MTGPQPVPAVGRARRIRWIAVVVGVAAVVGGLAVWWFRPGADVGQTNAAVGLATVLADDDVAHETEVVTPEGVYAVRFGEPVDRLAPDVLASDDDSDRPTSSTVDGDLLAPRGSSWWRVEWTPTGSAPATAADPLGTSVDRPVGGATLALAVDGEVVAGPYRLDGDPDPGVDALGPSVALAADGEVGVEVTFDGATQVVDASTGELDAGVTAAYYGDAAAVGPPRCRWSGDLPRGVGLGQLTCGVYGATVSPWDPQQGWVTEPGQTWVSVDLRVGAYSQVQVGDSAVYYETGGRLTGPVRSDGTPPVWLRKSDEPQLGDFAREVVGTWLVDDTATALGLRLDGELRLSPAYGGPPPPRGRVPLTASLEVPLTGA